MGCLRGPGPSFWFQFSLGLGQVPAKEIDPSSVPTRDPLRVVSERRGGLLVPKLLAGRCVQTPGLLALDELGLGTHSEVRPMGCGLLRIATPKDPEGNLTQLV